MKKSYNRERISQLLYDGTNAKDIAEIVDCSVPFVYLVAREIGFNFQRKSKLDSYVEEIKLKVENGASFSEIAREYGAEKTTVKRFCETRGIQFKPYEDRAKEEHEKFIESVPSIVDTNTSLMFEYLGGYTNHHCKVKCRCRICGRVSTITWQSICKRIASCSLCAEDEKRNNEEIKRQDMLARQEAKRIEEERLRSERQAKRIEEQEKEKINRRHPCPVCGKITERKKYCSNRCQKKVENKRREMKRRQKLKDKIIDTDITVESLFKRDGGICYLCGKACRLDDYIIWDDTFIAGNWYPSIDHVIPIAKGGEHSWKNVKLAHRICNSLKKDDIPYLRRNDSVTI